MNTSNFAQKLRSERKRLGHKQEYVADRLSMTQPGYSRMENGETNPGVKRSLEIIKLLAPHGYSGIPPIESEEIEGETVIEIYWPWNKYLLYAFIAVILISAIDYIMQVPDDLSSGFNDAAAGKPDPLIVGLLFLSGVFYGFYRLAKWLLLKRS